ncbi:MAG: hypothetical protein KDK89_22025 [Alphaproteobacteria bacterium]|nr:hypothetical protein [Alphaproteobacteria bacterium]
MTVQGFRLKYAGVSLLVFALPALAPVPGEAAVGPVSCAVSILYKPVGSTNQLYEKQFQVAVGQKFVDDFSTTTRQHIFTATLTEKPKSVVVDIDFFSDVSTFNFVDLATSLQIYNFDRRGRAMGSHQFGTTLSAGSYTMSYELKCLKGPLSGL